MCTWLKCNVYSCKNSNSTLEVVMVLNLLRLNVNIPTGQWVDIARLKKASALEKAVQVFTGVMVLLFNCRQESIFIYSQLIKFCQCYEKVVVMAVCCFFLFFFP